MKIAAATDDGKTICGHFGRASHFAVITIEDARVASLELRPKSGGLAPLQVGSILSSGRRQMGRAPHTTMLSTIEDCDVVLSGGMGQRMYENLRREGVLPLLTAIPSIEDAVAAYLESRLEHQPELLHS
ncbi:MAG: dinitrogenase iron-molybdenum cofactor biosynthesis protein [Armatimonadetes bacterium]|nr:dinitrogenase iron-molybdenum cofactor biosynthesis protein [Armatimonadota bacterium]